MRSAGCVINDVWDRNLDRAVARTATRPLASGEVTLPEAGVVLTTLLAGGLAVLTQFNVYTILLGASSMALVVIYPAMKRVTYVPQLVLGLAFNWGALLGYPALMGHQDWSVVVPLYVSGVVYTIIYDTIYAHQDASDDRKVGIKSTALLFGDNTKSVLSMLTVLQYAALAQVGVTSDLGVLFWTGGVLSLLYTARMIYKVNINNTQSCAKWFKSSQNIGWLIVAGLSGEYLASVV